MNAKTLEAVTRHGNSLLAAFPGCTEKDPVTLCKKLRRIENAVAPIILRNCNEGVPEAELDAATNKAVARVAALLGMKPEAVVITGLHVNRDPRGYALKLDDGWTRSYNADKYMPGKLPIYTDWGGYGIIAPDLTNER